MNPKDSNNLVKFGVMGVGQVIFAVITVWSQRTVSNWLTQKDIETYKPKPVRGFQATPLK